VSLTARQEHAKTLASALGLDEEVAASLLDVTIATAADDPASHQLKRHLDAMLARTVARVIEGDGGEGVRVTVGRGQPSPPGRSVRVGITSQEIVVSCVEMPPHEPSAFVPEIGLLIGACYAAAMAVRLTIGAQFTLPFHDTIRLPLDRLLGQREDVEGGIDIGTAYLAGAGAVGNGFVWALSTLNVGGTLHVVDPKNVSAGNVGRCLWFDEGDVSHPKAERLVLHAQRRLPRLKLVPRIMAVRELPERSDGAWLERLIVGADSRRARRRLQEELPREVFDASTTGIEQVVVSFNSAVESGACLSCVYYEDAAESAHEQHVAETLGVDLADVQQHYVSPEAAQRISIRYPQYEAQALTGLAYDTLFKTLCATGELRAEEGRLVLAPFSFVSVLAGSILALELVRRVASGKVACPYTHWRLSPWTSPVFELQTNQGARPGCETCGNPTIRATVRRLWGTDGQGTT
jgi:hypothetical protein